MTSLAAFLAEMEPFLLGDRSADETLAKLGPSPSGAHRFALYAELVARQRRGIVDHFYRTVRAAAEATSPGLFARIRDEYLRDFPPKHWDPNEAARAFPDFLSARPDTPACLAALADYAWVRFAAMHAPHDPNDVGLDVALFVRHYEWDVTSFSDAVEKDDLRIGLPASTPRSLLVGRHRAKGSLVVLKPSLGALLALRAAATRCADPLPGGIRAEIVVEEARSLEQLGLVPSGTSTRIGERLA
jgi:hypothetical protein